MIPPYYDMLLPIMEILVDNKLHTIREVIECLANKFMITREDRRKLTPVGKRSVFYTRVMWSVSTLRHAEILQNTERGVFKLTDRGRKVLEQKPNKIDHRFLLQFHEYQDFIYRNRSTNVQEPDPSNIETVSPIETIEDKCIELERDLYNELLSKVKNISPFVFENLVAKLLTAMGYGFPEEGKHTKQTRDGGIDGVISQDELGLEKIYFQAKRWNNNNVGIVDIHRFIGALHTQHAKKGVYITTSVFTLDAQQSVKDSGDNIALIDGDTLAKLLYKNNLGVAVSKTYTTKKIDEDFFENDI